jgi:hypothetical protein
MASIQSYPKVWNLGHPSVVDLFDGPVVAQEKVDGSQFSFQLGDDGALRMRSKGQDVYDDERGGRINSFGMFEAGIAAIESIRRLLTPNFVYRGEYLMKAKHNTLAYDRAPNLHVILFDVECGHHTFLSPDALGAEAARIGLEHVPYFDVEAHNPETINALLERVSVLGGQKIEGVVFKNYARFGVDGKVLMGKYVSEHFKEVHRTSWKTENPSQGDVVSMLAQSMRTPARWDKAIQHLRDDGKLTDSPKDIGPLLKEIQRDLAAEEERAIKDALYKWALPQISRVAVSGFADYYKGRLLEQQFRS